MFIFFKFYFIFLALIELDKLGIQHRNIKPSNILIDKSGNIQLVDFLVSNLEILGRN